MRRIDEDALRETSPWLWPLWTVLVASLGITVSAWYVSEHQVSLRAAAAFDRSVERTVSLLTERMEKYEVALRAGVGVLRSHEGRVDASQWRAFSESLDLPTAYPGINGVGVIFQIPRSERDAFLAEQRLLRPDFEVHPEHDRDVLFPITFIEPEGDNGRAIGLDLAFEPNRRRAAEHARDSGSSRITAPIVLVQDQEQTPGFLFFVPAYRTTSLPSQRARRREFFGLVYAPFVVGRLLEGVLAPAGRSTALRILDDGEVIYDEVSTDRVRVDPDPLLETTVRLPLYGRTWEVHLETDLDFREAVSSNQPIIVLLGGLAIDALLFGLFFVLARTRRRAVEIAREASRKLVLKNEQLAQSNDDLAQFAYIAAHDLKEPARVVRSHCEFLAEELADQVDGEVVESLGFVVESANRMTRLLSELFRYAKVGAEEQMLETVDANVIVDEVKENLELAIAESGATIVADDLPRVTAQRSQVVQLMQNLVANAIKFAGDAPPQIEIRAVRERDRWRFTVEDHGIGIEERHQERIFQIFQRLHARGNYEGSGVGLSIAKKIVERHGGTIRVRSTPGEGTTFEFDLSA